MNMSESAKTDLLYFNDEKVLNSVKDEGAKRLYRMLRYEAHELFKHGFIPQEEYFDLIETNMRLEKSGMRPVSEAIPFMNYFDRQVSAYFNTVRKIGIRVDIDGKNVSGYVQGKKFSRKME